ncbi:MULTISPECIES: hypothetical protein [unclassified Streptomyces]|uniref:hypothetical protein n=1 Tax=unclassified Streptomyces TaxID=2593676 RepID=UPI002E28155F|nr:hypothetical protein [Streptomyces sp. NBC_01439]
MTLHSSWVALTGQTRENTRLTQVGATTPANPLQARSGILPGSYDGQFRVSGFWMEGTSAMAATLNEGRAVIQGLSNQGAYPVTLDADVTLTFADGDALGNRIDLVVLRIYDGSYDTSGKYEAAVEIIRGTPSATPVAPAAPPLSLPLYKVSVPAGASAGKGGINWGTALTDLRVPTVSVGGILPVLGDIAPGAYPGQYQDSNGSLQRWDGTAWVPYPSAMGGIAPKGTVTTASYVGQYRDTPQRVLQRWSGTAWLPAFPGPQFAESLDGGSTTSVTYTRTLEESAVPQVQVTFAAPASGSVLLTYGARMSPVGNSQAAAYTSVRVTQGGTEIWAPDDERAVMTAGDPGTSASTTTRLSGLSADLPYAVTLMHRVSIPGVDTWFDNLFLRVEPMI